MKKIVSLLTLCALILSAQAADYTVGESNGTMSYVMPIVTSSSTYTSITQELYLATDLTTLGASAGNITGITFFYGGKSNNTAVTSVTRTIEVYLSVADPSFTEFVINSSTHKFKYLSPGTKVFDGNITTEALTAGQVKELPISFSSSYSWNGTNNLILTVIDKTNSAISDSNLRFALKSTTTARFIHINWLTSNNSEFSTYKSSLEDKEGLTYGTGTGWDTDEFQTNQHKYVNKLKFTIVAPTPAPTSPSAGSITTSSAVLSWTAAAGAESYEVRYGATSGSLGDATNVGNVTSYTLSDLEDETTYYYQIRTKIGSSYSAWTDEASFTTLAETAHTHNNITFSKWSEANSLPTSGDYYLNNDVTLEETHTLSGNLNLCLNGHDIYTETNNIIVPDGKTFAIFDNEGNGRIYGYYVSTYTHKGLISVETEGTLVISEGTIENRYDLENGDESFAIYSNGTFKLSGAPTIEGVSAAISLGSNKVITIESGKPITNSTPYSISKLTGVLTSGWANMNGANPSDYFVSSDASFGICLNNGEAQLVRMLALSDESANTDISDGTYSGLICASLNRSFTSASFNTICLPFGLSDDQLTDIFGSDYQLAEFMRSTFDGEEIYLEFNRQEELVAGKPYLIQPKHDVTNPTFEGVTITATSPSSQISDTYISVHGTYAPTELEGDNHNLLFLGAANTLYWPSSTGNIKGFRAYFEVKGAARGVARRASIIRAPEATTGISDANADNSPATRKFIRNGELIIEHNGVRYNALGQPLTR